MSDRQLRAAGMLVATATLAAGAAITFSAGTPVPRAAAEPSTSSTATATTSASPTKAEFPSDNRGYLDSAARCDDGQTMMMFGRTARSLVAVCVGPDGQLEYHGVRISDEAELTMTATRSADGAIVATNDDVTYSITPQTLLVSEGDTVIYRDTWKEFHRAGFAADSPTSSAPATTSTTETSAAETSTTETSTETSGAETSTPTVSTTTVSTTTVTPTPTG